MGAPPARSRRPGCAARRSRVRSSSRALPGDHALNLRPTRAASSRPRERVRAPARAQVTGGPVCVRPATDTRACVEYTRCDMATPRDAEPPPQLERRPEVRVFEIDELLSRVREGNIRIPSFRRGLRWDDSDRLDFFDSIYHGYPIGTLLFWQRQAPAARLSLGKLNLDAPARSDALWVVDGQQRITTLAETLLGHPTSGERVIHFDLGGVKFIYTKTREEVEMKAREGAEADDPPTLPLDVVLDSTQLLKWLFAHPKLGPAQRALALDVGKRLREYQLPCYIVETSDAQVLRTIFHRTNLSGRPLEEPEVFDALLGSLSEHQPSDLRHVAQRVSEMGFGPLPDGDVLKALLAVKGLPLDRDFTDALRRDEVPEALRSTEAALRETIVFLRRDAGFAHLELLPYTLPIVVLSKFFHEFPAPRERSRLLLRRWLWRGVLGARLTGATVGMRQHLACIRKDDEEGSVQRLLALAGTSPAEDIQHLHSFHFATARSKLQCCALASLRPRDLVSGETLDLPALLSARGEEKVPTVLRGKLAEDDRASGLANRILHPRLPMRNLIEAITATSDARVLASHAISSEARAALRDGNAARFLALREAALHQTVERYFQRQGEWSADDSPSLASMIVSED
ncbi:DUF262 domain-containing protein [Sorangium sp. So ce1099]|uniref:DUF262 domain-containing protein n=1 Tax=Sorangium sp. So ce1099 TaxID=3133331 RepID=UPI003F600BC5